MMIKHVHLLVTSDQPNGIAKLMQSIGRHYTKYINRSGHCRGSPWEARFKSSPAPVPRKRLGRERFSEIMDVAVAVRRAQRHPGRRKATRDNRADVEEQTDLEV